MVRTSHYPAPSPVDAPGRLKGTVDELPTVLIDRIAPGETTARRVQVRFPSAGQHTVQAELSDDAVSVDNRRWLVVDLPADVPVLMVDGDAQQRNAYFLSSIFQPGTRAKTGIRPTVQPPAFLRDAPLETLRTFRSIYLMDLDRLDDHAVNILGQYVRDGGGVAIFAGPQADLSFYTRWYADAAGLFPVPLERVDVVTHLDDAPDLTVSDHPLFRVLLGQRNPFIRDVRIDQYQRVPGDWSPPEGSTIRVLAELRVRQPLVAERRVGEGRVVAFMTTLSPEWNNWARQPSFIVVALELQAYLDSAQALQTARLVGSPLAVRLSTADYRRELSFVTPAVAAGQRQVVQRSAPPASQQDDKWLNISLGGEAGPYGGGGSTDRSGIYEAWPERLDAQPEVRRWSLNVDTRESDLALPSSEELADALQGLKLEIHQPDEIAYVTTGPAGFPWSQLLLVGLVGLLLGEQLLAYAASYHPGAKDERMIVHAPSLLAQSTRTYFELARLHSMDQWWHWLLLVAASALIVMWIVLLYVRDARELPAGKRWLLLTLRVLAFAGLLMFFLNLEKRSERQLVKNSRLLMLIDTSQSMGLVDTPRDAPSAGTTRLEPLVDELSTGDLLRQLRGKHDVTVYRFDESDRPVEIAALAKTHGEVPGESAAVVTAAAGRGKSSLREARLLLGLAIALLLLAVAAGAACALWGWQGRGDQSRSWALLAAVVACVAAMVTLAVNDLRNPVSLAAVLWGDRSASTRVSVPFEDSRGTDSDQLPTGNAQPTAWSDVLAPRGTKTRLGDALRWLVDKERGGPIAGVVVATDGRNNAGIDASAAVDAAVDAGIAVYTVGMGSAEQPLNVRVVDIEAPPRVYPGDRFTITGYLQASGLEGRTVDVQLSSWPDGGESAAGRNVEDQRRVQLPATGEVLPVAFEVTPDLQGRRVYALRVEPPAQDRDARDNETTVKVEIIDRASRVLLVAGGPTREFQFLRNQLFRDREVAVDVWLQTGRPGASQESDRLLFEFPSDAEQMFAYDCVVAFDPDWQQLDQSQLQLLERWVAEQAGGLILVPGPVYTPQWTQRREGDERMEPLKALCPVVFFSRASAALGGSYEGSDTPWRLDFTADGTQASFLWLDDTPLLSEQAWASFPGVYGFYTVRGAKPGATVYARFSNPQTSVDNTLPVYLAGQFYGAGRVFYQGSGEMWRLRRGREVLRAVLHQAHPLHVAGTPAARLQSRHPAGRQTPLPAGRYRRRARLAERRAIQAAPVARGARRAGGARR